MNVAAVNTGDGGDDANNEICSGSGDKGSGEVWCGMLLLLTNDGGDAGDDEIMVGMVVMMVMEVVV